MFTGGAESRSRYRSGLDVYIPARDKGPITDYPQTRFKFISRPERRSLPDKMWGRPGKRGHIYFVSPRLTPPRPLPRSGNVPKWQNICPGSLPICSDLRTLATSKSGLTFKVESQCCFLNFIQLCNRVLLEKKFEVTYYVADSFHMENFRLALSFYFLTSVSRYFT